MILNVLSDEPVRIRGNVHVEPFSPTVIAGMNATLKSLTAKAIAYTILTNYVTNIEENFKLMKKDLLEEYLKSNPITVNLVNGSLEQGEFIGLVLEDYRLTTRFVLSHLREELEGAEKEISDATSAHIERKENREYVGNIIKSRFQRLRYLVNPLTNDVQELKIKSIEWKLWENLRILRDVIKKVCGEFKEELESDDVLPLEASIVDAETVYVRDIRLGREVNIKVVSTAIASALQFLAIAYVFSTRHKRRVVVVEEPEESMAPVQQVTFMRYLSELMKTYSGDMNIVIVTTHSPYIAFATDSINHLAFYDRKERTFKVVESEIPRSFTYADILLIKHEGSSR